MHAKHVLEHPNQGFHFWHLLSVSQPRCLRTFYKGLLAINRQLCIFSTRMGDHGCTVQCNACSPHPMQNL